MEANKFFLLRKILPFLSLYEILWYRAFCKLKERKVLKSLEFHISWKNDNWVNGYRIRR